MPRSSRTRESSSRRSRSSRSRSRSEHRPGTDTGHSRHRHRIRIKNKEKNFWAAVCSMIMIVIICTALAEPRWIRLSGGGCSLLQEGGHRLNNLGVYQFFYMGRFLSDEQAYSRQNDKFEHKPVTVYQYGPSSTDLMYNCVTNRTVVLMKLIILVSFMALLCSLGQFLLDICGPTRRSLKILHRNALSSIFTVVLCVIINLICYWLTTEVASLQKQTKISDGSKVSVTFDISFYLIAAAGGVGVIATATNCLRQYPLYSDSQSSENLLDDYDGLEAVIPPGPDTAPMSQLPPPPAYTP